MRRLIVSLLLAGAGVAAPPIAPPVKSDEEIAALAAGRHKCVKCGFDCQCDKCKCPQAAGYETARVREDPPEGGRSAALKAGDKFLRGGWWYTADGTGNGVWCVECNGMTLGQAGAWWQAQQRPAYVLMPPVYAPPAKLPCGVSGGG